MKMIKWMKRILTKYRLKPSVCSHKGVYEIKRKYLQDYIQCSECGERIYDGNKEQFLNHGYRKKYSALEHIVLRQDELLEDSYLQIRNLQRRLIKNNKEVKFPYGKPPR